MATIFLIRERQSLILKSCLVKTWESRGNALEVAGSRWESHDKREIAAPKERRSTYCNGRRDEARRGSLSAEYFRNAAATKLNW